MGEEKEVSREEVGIFNLILGYMPVKASLTVCSRRGFLRIQKIRPEAVIRI